MSGTILPFYPCTFMAWTETALPLSLCRFWSCNIDTTQQLRKLESIITPVWQPHTVQHILCCMYVGAHVQKGLAKGLLCLPTWRWKVLFDKFHCGSPSHLTRDLSMSLCVPYLIMSKKVCVMPWKVKWLQQTITVINCLVAVSVLGWNCCVRHFMYVL
jgi:hypothetical protein